MNMTRILAALLLLSATAHAAPPPGTNPDSSLSKWFESLKVPGGSRAGISCCSSADCRPTHYRSAANGDMEAQTPGGAWVSVPAQTIIRRSDNPTGDDILCWSPYAGTYCFIFGSQT